MLSERRIDAGDADGQGLITESSGYAGYVSGTSRQKGKFRELEKPAGRRR